MAGKEVSWHEFTFRLKRFGGSVAGSPVERLLNPQLKLVRVDGSAGRVVMPVFEQESDSNAGGSAGSVPSRLLVTVRDFKLVGNVGRVLRLQFCRSMFSRPAGNIGKLVIGLPPAYNPVRPEGKVGIVES